MLTCSAYSAKFSLILILIFQKSMDDIGCTTPFGVNIDNICTDQNKSREALELFKSLVDRRLMISECPYPCKFIRSWITYGLSRSSEDKLAKNPKGVVLIFDKFIKITKAQYSYRGLELVADFGGYVGLFLGFSVFGFNEYFSTLLDYIM